MTPLEETLLIWKKAEEIKNTIPGVPLSYTKRKAIAVLNEMLSKREYMFHCPLCEAYKEDGLVCDNCPLGDYYGITENSNHYLACTPPFIRAVNISEYDHMIYVLEVLVQSEKRGIK